MKKLNCWEFKKCGRETNGINSSKEGVCPVAAALELDGVHDGKNGGRACWVVVGSFNNKAKHGKFVNEAGCMKCDFYKLVKTEQGVGDFKLSGSLKDRYEGKKS